MLEPGRGVVGFGRSAGVSVQTADDGLRRVAAAYPRRYPAGSVQRRGDVCLRGRFPGRTYIRYLCAEQARREQEARDEQERQARERQAAEEARRRKQAELAADRSKRMEQQDGPSGRGGNPPQRTPTPKRSPDTRPQCP